MSPEMNWHCVSKATVMIPDSSLCIIRQIQVIKFALRYELRGQANAREFSIS